MPAPKPSPMTKSAMDMISSDALLFAVATIREDMFATGGERMLAEFDKCICMLKLERGMPDTEFREILAEILSIGEQLGKQEIAAAREKQKLERTKAEEAERFQKLIKQMGIEGGDNQDA